jgi:hypothetical protein
MHIAFVPWQVGYPNGKAGRSGPNYGRPQNGLSEFATPITRAMSSNLFVPFHYLVVDCFE